MWVGTRSVGDADLSVHIDAFCSMRMSKVNPNVAMTGDCYAVGTALAMVNDRIREDGSTVPRIRLEDHVLYQPRARYLYCIPCLCVTHNSCSDAPPWSSMSVGYGGIS